MATACVRLLFDVLRILSDVLGVKRTALGIGNLVAGGDAPNARSR